MQEMRTYLEPIKGSARINVRQEDEEVGERNE
jgi:hypothetical protein